MCWYTDSLDTSFVIDYVPGYGDSLFVASGGSGYGFKSLPVFGQVCPAASSWRFLLRRSLVLSLSLIPLIRHVVNALERRPDQFTPLWHWRTASPGSHANGLEEGEMSGKNLATLEMADESDWLCAEDEAIKVGTSVGEDVTRLRGVEEVTAEAGTRLSRRNHDTTAKL